ncbi:MAG: dehydratase [Rhodobiaceae bacterium]|nr:dehydratase [Rhodobiaceae bacterium]|tara:strand:- start:234 stop:692 length:459 start_codon:yes stop_codon:yes gene_type:complete
MNESSTHWRYYEDVEIGEERRSKSLIISEKDILEFAQKYDPQWFHTDVEKAKDSSFEGLIASGIHVLAIWRLLDHDANGDVKYVCGIGWENVLWKNPLKPEYEVYVWSKCTSKSETSSKERGLATYAHGLRRVDGLDILTFNGTCLIYKKGY